MNNLIFFGDSLTAGYGLPAAASFPALIQPKLDAAGLPYQSLNYGVSGETSAGGRQRLPTVLARHAPAAFVLALGANDGLRGILVRETTANLRYILPDPGFGFAKTPAHNHELLRRLPELQPLGYGLLVGLSRKAMVSRWASVPKPLSTAPRPCTCWPCRAARGCCARTTWPRPARPLRWFLRVPSFCLLVRNFCYR